MVLRKAHEFLFQDLGSIRTPISKAYMMKRWIFLPLSALLFNGCISNPVPTYRPVTPKPEIKPVTPTPTPPPQNPHKLKAVEDNNFSPEYMYPQAPKTKTKEIRQSQTGDRSVSASSVSREECISMIGQEKFDRYTQMLGGEAGAIKRCTLLKAMK